MIQETAYLVPPTSASDAAGIDLVTNVPGQAPTVWATGLTTVQGCGFGRDGAFYAT